MLLEKSVVNCPEVKKNVVGLLNYSKEIHAIKSKVITDYITSPSIRHSKFGYELESYENINIGYNNGDSSWISIERMERSNPPSPPEECLLFLKGVKLNNPKSIPQLKKVASYRTSFDEASDLMESGLVLIEDCSEVIHDSQVEKLEVQLLLKLKNWQHTKVRFESWLDSTWSPWAESELKVLAQIEVYKRYFEIHQELKRHSDDFEIVLSQGFVFHKNEYATIASPLIEHVLESSIDKNEGFKIKFCPKENGRRIITEPFSVANLSGSSQLRQVIEELLEDFNNQLDVYPLPFNQTYSDRLGIQVAALLHSDGKYLDCLTKPEASGNQLTVTNLWMLSIQPKSVLPYIDNIQQFKKQIESIDNSELSSICIAFGSAPSDEPIEEDKSIDLGTKFIGSRTNYSDGMSNSAVVNTHNKQSMEYFFSLPANPEQMSILEMLSKSDAVAVQGPPGTGKSHTIANIVGHYMATGKKVLISAKTAAALAGVREKLPETLAKLTISILDNDQEGKEQVEDAISFISSEVQTLNIRQAQEDILKLESEIFEKRKRSSIIESTLLKYAEVQFSAVNYSNHSLTPQDLVKFIKSEPVESDWLTDEITLEDKYIPIFDDDIVSRIRELRACIGDDLVYTNLEIPDIRTNLDLPEIKRTHERLQQSKEISAAFSKGNLPEPAVTISDFDVIFHKSKQLFESVSEIIYHARHNSEWLEFTKLFFDKNLLNEERCEIAGVFSQALIWLNKIEKKLFLTINIDAFDQNDKDVRNGIARAMSGESPFGIFGIFKNKAKNELEKIRIRGESPKSIDDWKQVKEFLDLVDDFVPLKNHWNNLASFMSFPIIPNSTLETITFLKQHRRILNVAGIGFNEWLESLTNIETLYPWGIKHDELHKLETEFDKSLNSMRQWESSKEFEHAKRVPEFLIEIASKSTSDIFIKLNHFAKSLGSNTEAQLIGEQWIQIRAELERIASIRPLINELYRLCDLIAQSGAPQWAYRLKHQPATGLHDPFTPTNWRSAWEYRRALGFLSSLPSRNKINELSSELSDHENDIRKKMNRLIEIRSLLGLKKSLTNRISSALNRFSAAFSKIGKNVSGKRSVGHCKEAKDAMSQCFDAIPCWIIPEGKVAEHIPAKLRAFDLVIIDEASQSDITSIPVILRGDKLLIVGDDKQVSPSLVGIKEDRIQNLIENWLYNHPLKRSFHPENSLYDLVGIMSPGKKVMLREHFRCVERIISFCSKKFYSEPLIPLRQSTMKERLDPPLIDIFVKDGIKNREVNIREAEVIVEEIEKIVKTSSMAHRTIGVISLIGFKQASRIQQMLFERLGVEIMTRHKIECGDARYFQGQERDIVFLSMVASPGQSISQSAKDVQQRYNVAVSRARDRLVLVRSVGLDDLQNPDDLKVKLINHFYSSIDSFSSQNNKIELCESQFEREVYKRLIDKGYQVEPQVSAGRYRIDFVIYGSNDVKLAIELDGDQYHGPDRFAQDQIRQKQLERVGWRFWRCWASDWYLDSDACFIDLLTKLDEMGISPCGVDNTPNLLVRHEIRGDGQTSEELLAELEFFHDYSDQEVSLSDSEFVEVGDDVLIFFDDDHEKILQISLSNSIDDPSNKIVHESKPLAQALLGLMSGDNFELMTDKLHKGVIKGITKAPR